MLLKFKQDYDLPIVKIHGVLNVFICDQVTDDYTVIGKNLFKKETNLQLFVGLKVTLSSGESGVIDGSFGQSGKIKIRVPGMKNLRTHTNTQCENIEALH